MDDATIRTITITGMAEIWNMGDALNDVELDQPPTMRLHVSGKGSMANMLRLAATIVENNIKENGSTTVTIRQNRAAMHAKHRASLAGGGDDRAERGPNGKILVRR